MRAVLDTNVLVSGLLNPHGTPGQILVAVMAERIEVVYDPRLLTEYRRVLLQREFPFEVPLSGIGFFAPPCLSSF